MTSTKRNDKIRLLVLKGDGIGPEISRATVDVLHAVGQRFGLSFDFEDMPIGFESLEKMGTTFPAETLDAALNYDGVILGPVSHFEYPDPAEGGLNPSGQLRKGLDLFANVRPAKTRPGFAPRCGVPFDLIVVRENTEGFYADRAMYMGPGEFMPTKDLAMSLRKISREGSVRIAKAAFDIAMSRPRKKVTAVHKANVLRVCDSFFLDCVREVASQYPDVEYDERIVDAMAALLVRDPSEFDVIVTTNMFGDILSDLASEISGSLGLAASLNCSDQYAVAQAQHGSAPDIAGKNIANPSSLIGSAAMLLSWLSERRDDPNLAKAADAIDRALSDVIGNPETRTPDLGGNVGTKEFAEAIVAKLA